MRQASCWGGFGESVCVCECVPDTRLEQYRGGSADSCRPEWLGGSAAGLCWVEGCKLVPKWAQPGIKMWQLNKRAQVMRSFQSDLSVWRWSCSVHSHQQLLPLSFSFSFSPSQSHRETQLCCLCLWLLSVQLWMHVSVYMWNMWKSNWFSVSHCLKPFSPPLLLSVHSFCLPSPSLVQESSQSWWHFQFFCFFVVLSPGDLFALSKRSRHRVKKGHSESGR